MATIIDKRSPPQNGERNGALNGADPEFGVDQRATPSGWIPSSGHSGQIKRFEVMSGLGHQRNRMFKKELQIGGRTLSLETGTIARQANGACVIRYGDTVVLDLERREIVVDWPQEL